MEEKQLVIAIISGVAVTIFITLFVLFLSVRERKRYLTQQDRLDKLHAEKEQDTLKSVMRTVENERMRIARDLHDSVGSTLSMIRLELEARLLVNSGNPKDNPYRETLGKIDDVVSTIRSVCFQLYPTHLSNYGFNGVLDMTLTKWKESAKLAITYSNQVSEERYGPSMDFKLNLFRVFEEVLNNIVKHGRCTRASITVTPALGNTCLITILHNGLPFDEKQAIERRHAGIGLFSITSRLDLIRGSISYVPGENLQTVLIKAPITYG